MRLSDLLASTSKEAERSGATEIVLDLGAASITENRVLEKGLTPRLIHLSCKDSKSNKNKIALDFSTEISKAKTAEEGLYIFEGIKMTFNS